MGKESEYSSTDVRDFNNRIDWLEKEKKKDNVIVSGLKIETQDPVIIKYTLSNMIKYVFNI